MAKIDPREHLQTFGPCTPKETDDALEEAEQLARKRGQKMTRIRRKVLRLLLESPKPAKAYDLLNQLDGEGSAKPPTIYRALDFLQNVGLAHKIESLNAYVACGHANHNHAAVFLICDTCSGAEELHGLKTLEVLTSETDAAGFRMKHAVIEARGRCRKCAAN
ncbi:MAG: transcriptional repressor [Pseudomonadota bacterium]